MDIIGNHERNRINKVFKTVDKKSDKFPEYRAFVIFKMINLTTQYVNELVPKSEQRNKIFKPSMLIFDEMKQLKYRVFGNFNGVTQSISIHDMHGTVVAKLRKHRKFRKKDYVEITYGAGGSQRLYTGGSTDVPGLKYKGKLLSCEGDVYFQDQRTVHIERKASEYIVFVLDGVDERVGLALTIARYLELSVRDIDNSGG